MMENFEDYISAINKLRLNENYVFTEEQINCKLDFFRCCWKGNMSPYKALEIFYFEFI